MTTTEHPTPDLDARLVANDARSILACPASVSLVIEGEEHAVADDDQLGLTDHRGTPTFLCPADSAVARAAAAGGSALLTVTSGLGPRGGRERGDTLTLAGRLERTGFERCDCCDELRHVVALDLNFVLLARPTAEPGVPVKQVRVPVEAYRSRDHHLNRGHLQRSVEHANDCHQVELRQAVALGTGTAPADLLGVRIARLTPTDVTMQWVDTSGAHERAIAFPRCARDLTELGEMLRRGLHAGIC
ncbi:hypothetical protein [Nocardioides sp. YIM 152315]|uniref:hypothetical protein n=1 Tax=Nocardioides sp. YIM 152315 TaxID=3031760 RepID=UPI0023DC6041|nr:hypothetical protein [Nocardioides sp. YIM 152315]MDF1602059.1 hypothetical protein [Nocardioides sp. YIM 152315]